MGLRDRKVARDALVVAHTAVEIAGNNTELLKGAADSVSEAGALARRAVDTAEKLADMLAEKDKKSDLLSPEELEKLAEAYPQWTVSSGIRDGEPFKTYSRNIQAHEFKPELIADVASQKELDYALVDAEYFDANITTAFDSWSAHGDWRSGNGIEITITAEQPGPVDYQDVMRIGQAEAYLQTTYLAAQEEAQV